MLLKGPEVPSQFTTYSIGSFFNTFSQKHSSKTCQLDADTGKSETFGSLRSRSIRLALQLRRKGVARNDVIASCSFNSLDNSLPLLATAFLGAKIGHLDPTSSQRQLTHLLNICAPRIVFVQRESLELLRDSATAAGLAPELLVFEDLDLGAPEPGEDAFQPTPMDPKEDFILFFSSGTSGLPKAICHSSESFLRSCENTKQCLQIENSILHFNSFYWIGAIVYFIVTFMGGLTRVFSRATHGPDILKIIERFRVGAIFAAPMVALSLLAVPEPELYDVSSIKLVTMGGTTTSMQAIQKIEALFQRAAVIFCYGMTEIGLATHFNPVTERDLISRKGGSCGKPAQNNVIKIVDPDTDRELASFETGEVRIKSNSTMTGYYGMDSSNCFDPDGFLKTGDLGYYDEDGCLYVTGRIRESFKFQSIHVVPSAVESVILEAGDVKECVVFGVPAGDEGEKPAAWVVVEPGAQLTEMELVEFVNERVSDVEKLRGGVTFVESLPKTVTGKLQRAEVRSKALSSH